MKLILSVIAFLALASPAFADACTYTLDTVLPTLTDMQHIVISDPDAIKALEQEIEPTILPGADGAPAKFPDGITRFLVVLYNGGYSFGFELDGCLSRPFRLPAEIGHQFIPAVSVDSGRTNAGTGA